MAHVGGSSVVSVFVKSCRSLLLSVGTLVSWIETSPDVTPPPFLAPKLLVVSSEGWVSGRCHKDIQALIEDDVFRAAVLWAPHSGGVRAAGPTGVVSPPPVLLHSVGSDVVVRRECVAAFAVAAATSAGDALRDTSSISSCLRVSSRRAVVGKNINHTNTRACGPVSSA